MPRQSVETTLATPEHIAAIAVLIVDEEGPDALTFRALASRLGVSVATIQRRCKDQSGLLDLCADYLAAQLRPIPEGTPWAEATELRFARFYRLLTAHPGLVVLRGNRPWLGRELLHRLTEPALASSIAAGMTPEQAISAYRGMYLLTLGCASFVDHFQPEAAQAATRGALAALDPEEFPALTGNIGVIIPAVIDDEVYYRALRQLITASNPQTHTTAAGTGPGAELGATDATS